MSTPSRLLYIAAAALTVILAAAELAGVTSGHHVPHAIRIWLIIPAAACFVTATLMVCICSELRKYADRQQRSFTAWCEYVATHDQVVRSRNSLN